tara:strand:- start:5579 stop:6163 length:585 start_codon:yes stop_codon:yes gene_type:complete
MIELILQLDLYLFHIINTDLNNTLFNYIFIFFHDCHKNIGFILPLLLLWIFFIFRDKKNRIKLIVLIPLAVLITDQIGSKIKDLEIRKRPYMKIDEDNINLLVNTPKNKDGLYKNTKSSKKSFPSNHSANIWALSTILSYMYNSKKKYFMILAILVSISRVYVGVHYPLDIIAGAVIGLIVSFLIIKLSKQLIR